MKKLIFMALSLMVTLSLAYGSQRENDDQNNAMLNAPKSDVKLTGVGAAFSLPKAAVKILNNIIYNGKSIK